MLNNVMRSAPCALLILLIVALLPDVVCTQGLIQGFSGNVEFNYNLFSSKTKLSTGETVKTESTTYNPRISLNVNTKIFPNLKLDAGALFEGNSTRSKLEDTRSEMITMSMRPYINLTLENPLYKASVGYYRRQEKTDLEEGEKLTVIRDEYIGSFNWRPEGFPSIETQFVRRNTYDLHKLIVDSVQDSVSLSSRYGYEGLELRYWGTYDNLKNDLDNVETRNITHYGRAGYSKSLFDRRINLNTTYEVNYQETKITAEGVGGEVDFQVFPLSGLSSIDSTPLDGALDPNPALIDGDLLVSAGINIGRPPIGGDFNGRNMGFDFFVPTEVNKILVWVDRELPQDIANSFEWKVYVSSDNLNWTFAEALFSAPFGPFQNRFEIKFSGVVARYVKVATTPLSAIIPGSAAFPNIFITEIQAFVRRPVSAVSGQRIKKATHNYTLDVKSRVLNIPTLYHELNFIYYREEPEGDKKYTISNAFSIDHRFSRIFSGRARAAYEYGKEEKEKRNAYIYYASLDAVPLKTLRNSLVFSGQHEDIENKSDTYNSIFLYNTAQLYKGLDINLNLGYSFSEKDSGENLNEGRVNLLTNIIPHPSLNIALDYSYSNKKQSGDESLNSSTYVQSGNITVTYTPFRTLFLLGSLEIIAPRGEKRLITQEYGLNWSPFPDGALRFSLTYNENYRSENHQKERVFTPSIRYDFSKRSYIDVSYNMIRNRNDTQKTDSNLFSVSMKIFF